MHAADDFVVAVHLEGRRAGHTVVRPAGASRRVGVGVAGVVANYCDRVERNVLKFVQPTGCARAIRSARSGRAFLVDLDALGCHRHERQQERNEQQGLSHSVLL